MKDIVLRLPPNVIKPLGVSRCGGQIALVYKSKRRGHTKLSVASSSDGTSFIESPDPIAIMKSGVESEDVDELSQLRLSCILSEKVAIYHSGSRSHLARQAFDADLDMAFWERLPLRLGSSQSGVMVEEYKSNGQYVIYYGGQDISVALSRDLTEWKGTHAPILGRRPGLFDEKDLCVSNAEVIKQGILLSYSSVVKDGRRRKLCLGLALCSKENPAHVLWRSETPAWSYSYKPKRQVNLIGTALVGNELIIYLVDEQGRLRAYSIPQPYAADIAHTPVDLRLHRHYKNPIITPEGGEEWEQAGTFNPAVVVHDGQVHLFYRAMGYDGISRIGYARSSDGVHFERSRVPAYDHGVHFKPPKYSKGQLHYNPDKYASGGGWGGSEDARAVVIDDQLYITFGIFENWFSMRMAIMSMPLDVLGSEIWQWTRPFIISPPDEAHKNWVLFPEKIHGKYAVLHALTPGVMIEYADDISDFEGKPIQSNNHRSGRRGAWDGFVRGAAAPPVKTADGWLLFYHGMDPRMPQIGYKVGAMLLDLGDPTKILHRTSRPILVPEQWYENQSKEGVVYASGAVLFHDKLFVYYGGGDRHVCIATANLDDFLRELKADKAPHIDTDCTTLT